MADYLIGVGILCICVALWDIVEQLKRICFHLHLVNAAIKESSIHLQAQIAATHLLARRVRQGMTAEEDDE